MIKLLVFICFLIAAHAGWMIGLKIYKTSHQRKKWLQKLPSFFNSSANVSTTDTEERLRCEVVIDAYELQLFDDVARLFFQAAIKVTDREQAQQLQQKWLNRMPMQTSTLIRKMDLEEWSIYWNFYDQSLEYYVGRYGIFCTHVDRHGEEHKQEYYFESQHADCA